MKGVIRGNGSLIISVCCKCLLKSRPLPCESVDGSRNLSAVSSTHTIIFRVHWFNHVYLTHPLCVKAFTPGVSPRSDGTKMNSGHSTLVPKAWQIVGNLQRWVRKKNHKQNSSKSSLTLKKIHVFIGELQYQMAFLHSTQYATWSNQHPQIQIITTTPVLRIKLNVLAKLLLVHQK